MHSCIRQETWEQVVMFAGETLTLSSFHSFFSCDSATGCENKRKSSSSSSQGEREQDLDHQVDVACVHVSHEHTPGLTSSSHCHLQPVSWCVSLADARDSGSCVSRVSACKSSLLPFSPPKSQWSHRHTESTCSSAHFEAAGESGGPDFFFFPGKQRS